MQKYLPIIRKSVLIILLISVIVTVAFIFSNSLKTPEESTADSDSFGDFVATIIPPETELGELILEYIRKIAHFSEYGLLGIEVALIISLYLKRWWRFAIISLPGAVALGVIDESLQYISERGPEISDVWIDFGGFAFFSAVTYLAVIAARLIIKRIKNKTEVSCG